MWELNNKESWEPKNRWFSWLLFVLEKTLESPLDCKETQPVYPKRNQSWIYIGRTDAEAETPIVWPPDWKDWLIWKDPDVGKDWRQEKGMTEDELVGWHYQLNEHEQTLGVGDGQGSLACCRPWGRKESDMTERLNWTEMNWWYTKLPALKWIPFLCCGGPRTYNCANRLIFNIYVKRMNNIQVTQNDLSPEHSYRMCTLLSIRCKQILNRALCGAVYVHGNIGMNSSVQRLRPLLGKGHFCNKISLAFSIWWNKSYICVFFLYRRKPSQMVDARKKDDKNNNSNRYWVFKQVFCVNYVI